MKRNIFDEVIAQPGDDPYALFAEHMALDMSDNLIAAFFIEYDEDCKWSCELQTECSATMEAHDFESEEGLRNWLALHGIETLEIN